MSASETPDTRHAPVVITYSDIGEPVYDLAASDIRIQWHLEKSNMERHLENPRQHVFYSYPTILTVMTAPAYMNGQRAPFNGPSESQAQESAMTMKIAVFGSGTVYVSAIDHAEE